MRRTPVLLGAAVLSGALAVTAGAVALRTDTKIDPVADRVALIKNMDPEGNGGAYFRSIRHLAEMLPNAKHGTAGTAVSDSVVVGTITGVSEHTGVMDVNPPPGVDGDIRNERVPFDSPTAHWRNLKVTVTVTDVLAGPQVTTVVFDWGVLGKTATGDDADAIGRALQNLGTVMVTTKPARANTIGQTRRIADPWAGLAQIAADGTVSFLLNDGGGGTALEVARADEAFTQGVDTVEEVRQEAAKPAWKAPTYKWGEGG